MAKYKLKTTSVYLGGVVHKVEDGVIFDTEDPKWVTLKAEIEAAHKAGFLKEYAGGETKEAKITKPVKK